MFVMLLWVYIHTGQAWKICLATVGIEPTTFGILDLGTAYNNQETKYALSTQRKIAIDMFVSIKSDIERWFHK
jgi:hypothetical protein